MSVSEPSKILTPWATSGLKNTIPSTADPVTGKAGYDQGFPPINMTAKEAGGIPPFGQDFNGIFFDITQILQYMQAGGHPTYSSALSSAIGGYPLGAMLAKASGLGFWRNITTNNTTNPDSGGAGWVSDSPGCYANASTVTASSTTLTASQVGQAFLFTTAASTVALPAASSIAAGGVYKLHTSAGFTLSVTGGGAIQAGSVSVTSLSVPAGTEVLAVSTGSSWWAFGTGQALSNIGVVGGYRGLKISADGTSTILELSAGQIALDSVNSGVTYLVKNVTLTANAGASGVNGLDVGTVSASTWYSVWVISNGATTASLLSLSATAPTMPAGYVYRRRVGWVFVTASSVMTAFLQYENRVQLKAPVQLSAEGVDAMVSLPVPDSAYSSHVGVSWPGNASVAVFIFVAPDNTSGYSENNAPACLKQSSNIGANAGSTSTDIVLTVAKKVYCKSTAAGSKSWCYGWRDAI